MTLLATNPAPPRGTHRLRLIQWLMIVVPACVVFVFELVCDNVNHPFPLYYCNYIAGAIVLTLVAAFARILSSIRNRSESEAAAHARQLALLEGVLQERDLLSREMHDGSAQVLASVRLRLETIENLLARGLAGDATAEIGHLRAAVDLGYTRVRAAIAGLRGGVGGSVESAITALCEDFQDQSAVDLTVVVAPSVDGLSPLVRIQLMQILREALANIGSHSQATTAELRVEPSNHGSLRVSVHDNGVGVDLSVVPGPPHHFGFTMMRERAESVGGWLGVVSRPGAGTTVVAELPGA